MEPDRGGRFALPRDALVIVLCGVVAGLAFNLAQRQGRPPRGLPWVASVAALPSVDSVAAIEVHVTANRAPEVPERRPPAPAKPAPASSAFPALAETRPEDDAPVVEDLPSIPDVDHPLAVRLPLVSRFVRASAALVVDARAASEFAAGHIPGAINVPYEEATHDPAPLGALAPGVRPIIVYCSGGDCEASAMLAQMMIRDFKLRRVLVYEGGYPEWLAAGMPVRRGGS